MNFIDRKIEQKLGGYKLKLNRIEENSPLKLETSKKVAVIGGGIAGITSAIYLTERGFDVILFEKNEYLGGKIGSWSVTFNDGFKINVEHGFHAFFRQYYNLKELLNKIDAAKYLIPIDDYLILTKKYGNFSFKNISKTPVKNILSMRNEGVYSFADAMFKMDGMKLLELLKYNAGNTFGKFDEVSFKQFADETRLTPSMRLMFTTFSRAFFAEPKYISMAELIKSFHFYFLSNDHGLIYDVLDDDFEKTFLNPAQNFIENNGGKILLNTSVSGIEKSGAKYSVNGQLVDYVVLASDIPGTKKIIRSSSFIKNQFPELKNQIEKLKVSQRYAVLRIWTDKKLNGNYPFFIFTDALEILDSITIYHQMEKSSEEWAEKNNGGIYELHCYALPDEFDEAAVRNQLIREFKEYFPEMKGAEIYYENLQVKNDFTAFHKGLYNDRPKVKTEIDHFYLAGDWVKLPCPAMLMEAAATSALLAVNDILAKENLKEEVVWSVPVEGIIGWK